MKTATMPPLTWNHIVSAPIVYPKKLVELKIKGFCLIGTRDYTTEYAITAQIQKLSRALDLPSLTHLKLPKLYTLVSQNCKISINEILSSKNRLFLNFESFKWSELYFQFFKPLTHSTTNKFISKNVLYSLDPLIGHFKSLIASALDSKAESNALPGAIERWRAQSLLTTFILNHEQAEALLILYVYELILIAINQSQRSHCAYFVNLREAKLILGYFFKRNLIKINDGRLELVTDRLAIVFRDYVNHNGNVLVSSITDNYLSQLEDNFKKIATAFDQEFFEAPFIHTS